MSFVCFKQKTAYEIRISDLSSDVCSSDLDLRNAVAAAIERPARLVPDRRDGCAWPDRGPHQCAGTTTEVRGLRCARFSILCAAQADLRRGSRDDHRELRQPVGDPDGAERRWQFGIG